MPEQPNKLELILIMITEIEHSNIDQTGYH